MRTITSPVVLAVCAAAVVVSLTSACANTTPTRLGSPASSPSAPVAVVASPTPESTLPSVSPRPKPAVSEWPVLVPVAHPAVPVDARIGHAYFIEYQGATVILAELGTDGRMYPVAKLVPGFRPTDMVLVSAPNGQKVAWVSNTTAFTANLDGTDRHQLPGEAEGGCGAPAWSPDATRLVYGIVQKSGQTRLYMVNADGSGRRVLDSIGGCAPVWSSDGSMIAYMQSDGMSGKVITIRPDGTGRRLVPIVTWHKLDYVYSISSLRGSQAIVAYDEPVQDGEGCGDGNLTHNLAGNAILNLVTGRISRIPGAPVAPDTSGRLTDDATANVTFASTGSLLVQRILTRYLDANHVGSQILELRAPDGTRVATRVIKAADLSHSPALTARAG